MFRGQFVHTIDAKGRVSLPARFREAALVDGDARLVLTPAPSTSATRSGTEPAAISKRSAMQKVGAAGPSAVPS